MNSRRPFLILTSLVIASSAFAQDAKSGLDAAFAGVEPRVIAWRHDIHQNPELSNREFRTSALVADHLRELGLDDVAGRVARRLNELSKRFGVEQNDGSLAFRSPITQQELADWSGVSRQAVVKENGSSIRFS